MQHTNSARRKLRIPRLVNCTFSLLGDSHQTITGRDVVMGRGVLTIGLVSVIFAMMVGYAAEPAERKRPYASKSARGRRGFARRRPNDRSCGPIGGPARTLAFRYLDQRRCKLGFLVFNHAPVRPLTQREPRGFETTP